MAEILIVEDDTELRANLRRFLLLEGHTVLEAVNGREGIDLALRHRPRVIICDLMMPERDGMDVLRAIRAAPQTQDTAFCFVTGSAEKSTREQSYAAGVDAYLTKPFDLAELRATIVALLR